LGAVSPFLCSFLILLAVYWLDRCNSDSWAGRIAQNGSLPKYANFPVCRLSNLKDYASCPWSFLLKKNVADEEMARFVSEHNDISSIRRFLYSISFMMKNATSYRCATDDFETECTHLGLPPEHSKMLARVFASNLDVLKQYVKNSIPKEPPLESVTISEEDPSTPVLRYTRNGKTTVCQLTGEQLSAMRSDMDFVWDNIKVKFRDW
ncbi:hypothetical protein COOONC_03296, partial [Cooperia oncophora]